MISKTLNGMAFALAPVLCSSFVAEAGGRLDGMVFTGMIGPVENPDLADSLSFDSGYFWSGICTRCGFVPGRYSTEETGEGIVFTGTLESETRGRFDYEGLIGNDGSIAVSISRQRRRWYWTTRREIAFIGRLSATSGAETLESVRQRMDISPPEDEPACARF